MRGMNKVFLLGNVGGDPQAGISKSGKPFSNFSVATNEMRKNTKNQFEEVAQWHKVSFYGTLAELANKYIKKGSKVLIEGKIDYQKKSKGPEVASVTYTNIYGSGITLLDRPKELDVE
ncbi:MAG TPA: single-stranded DNA-binding protein [Candidatus Wallbacteria bacterium]|nr:single-stranded DNA-binding protein [Candidatus Wallbacteria bacterium]